MDENILPEAVPGEDDDPEMFEDEDRNVVGLGLGLL